MDTCAVRNALNEARAVMSDADEFTRLAIHRGAARLRRLGVDEDALRGLKRELTSFNARTGKWRK